MTWQTPPLEPLLAATTVHCWRAALDPPPAAIERYHGLLDSDEEGRAARYHFKHHGTRFVVARGILRTILGRYLRVPAAQIRFRHNAHGKPALDATSDGVDLRFNVSHSVGVALYAVAAGREVGVDVEQLRADLQYEAIAATAFSPAEQAQLSTLPPHLRQMGFFNCWTRKEAYIKARGMGLAMPLDSFDVSLIPGEPAALLRTADDPDAVARWSLRELTPGAGFAGAVAAEGHEWTVVCWQFDG